MGKTRGYSLEGDQNNACKAKLSNARVHFKNTVETCNAIQNMCVKRAQAYLKNVLDHKECIPFRKYKGGVGRCGQAKAFGTTQGRWPQKSATILLSLVKTAVSNAEYKGFDCDNLKIVHVQANPSRLNRRRTYRAHGRITPYMGHNCHIQVVLKEMFD